MRDFSSKYLSMLALQPHKALLLQAPAAIKMTDSSNNTYNDCHKHSSMFICAHMAHIHTSSAH